MAIGITSFGAYIPRLRLARRSIVEANAWFNPGLKSLAKGERAVCNWDEDSITLAVEAARDCLVGHDRAAVKAIYMASTSYPSDDRQNSGVVAQALNLASGISSLDIAASQRAGTAGLIAALQAASGGGGPILVIASEKRRTKAASVQELTYGDGAAALLVDGTDPIARFLGNYTETVDFIDHYRGHGRDFDYGWEERWIRDEGYLKIVPATLVALFAKTGIEPGSIAHFCMPTGMARIAQAVARKVGLPEASSRDNLQAICGETGAAHPLVMLAHALEHAKPGERILVVSFGQGCDALIFEATESLAKLPKHRGVSGSLARRY